MIRHSAASMPGDDVLRQRLRSLMASVSGVTGAIVVELRLLGRLPSLMAIVSGVPGAILRYLMASVSGVPGAIVGV